MSKTIHPGSGSGFQGGRIELTVILIWQGKLDYPALESLAERIGREVKALGLPCRAWKSTHD